MPLQANAAEADGQTAGMRIDPPHPPFCAQDGSAKEEHQGNIPVTIQRKQAARPKFWLPDACVYITANR